MLRFDQLSYWEKKAILEDIDFVVVGAGLVGVSTALSLRESNPSAKIVVVERGYLSTGASTKNAGFACFGSATELIDDLSKMPATTVWDTVELRFKGLKRLLERFGNEQIGYRQSGSWDLIRENDQLTEQTTREQIHFLNAEIGKITGEYDCFSEDKTISEKFGFAGLSTSFHNCLEGEIRTNQLLLQFNRLLAENNIITLYGIEVKELEFHEKSALISTNFGDLSSKKVAVTVNGFANKLLGDERIKPARAQVLVTSPIENLKLKGTFHYDAGYYYFRNIENRILLGGGRNLDFDGETTVDFGNTQQITNALDALLKNTIIPGKHFEIDYQWSGIMGIGNEKKPIIELIHPNVAIGVRMGGMGVAIGTTVGEEVAKLLK